MEIKERILKKSEELYFTRGLRSVTMDDIATALGISKKTIYQHFSDKDTLVYSVMKYAMSQEMDRCLMIADATANPLEEIILSVRILKELLATMNPSLMHDLQKYYPKAWQLHLEQKKLFLAVVTNNLTQGVEQGYYRANINVSVLAIMRIESIDQAFDNTIYPPKEFNILDVQLSFTDHFIRGIVTEKGLKAYELLVKEQI